MKLTNCLLCFVGLFASAAAFSSPLNRRDFVGAVATTTASVVVATPSVVLADDATASDADGFIATESGLKYKVLKEGTGAIPEPGQTVKAHYTGWLDGFDSIKKFDSSRDRGRPFSFRVGAGQVIRGWDESFSTMKVGERRQIILPPRLAYGKNGCRHQRSDFVFCVTRLRFEKCGIACRVGWIRLLSFRVCCVRVPNRRPWCWRYHSTWCNSVLRCGAPRNPLNKMTASLYTS